MRKVIDAGDDTLPPCRSFSQSHSHPFVPLIVFFPQLLSCLFQLLFLYDASFGPSCHYSSIPPHTAPFHFSISLQQFWSGPFLLCPVPGISLAPFCFGNITARKILLLLLFLNLR